MYTYNSMLNGHLSHQRHQEIIRQVQEMRRVQIAKSHDQHISQRIVTPVRRAARFVAALVR